MANDLNQCTFTGRLAADPEVRTAGSSKVANFRIACGEQWKDKQSGERKEKVEWIGVTIWGDGLVGVVESYLKKGSRVLVQGKMQTREYEKDGIKRYATDVVIQGFGGFLQMLDSKPSDGGSRDSGGSSSGGYSGGGQAANSGGGGFADDDDMSDVPF